MIRVLKNIYHELVNSKYMKDIFVLTTGVGFSQLIPLLLLPILTRFFSPTEFGVLAIFMAITQLLAISSTFRLEMAVVLPKKDTDAAILCLMSFFTLLFMSILISLFLFVLLKFIIIYDFNNSTLFNDSHIHSLFSNLSLIYLIPIGAICLGVYNILYSWNNRMGLYKNMSFSHITHSIFSTPLAILFYFVSFKSFALILGQIIGRFFACLFLLKNLFQTIRLIHRHTLIHQIRVLSKDYRKFILYETPHTILNFFSQKIIIAFFSVFFGLFTVGIFDLADKIIAKPLGIISNSFKTVFYKRLTTAQDKINIFKKSVFLMTVISCLLVLPFYFIPDDFFIFLLGSEWGDTGKYIKLLCPLLFVRFITNVITPSISYSLQNHHLLIWQILYFSLLLCLFFYIHSFSVEDVLFLYALLGAIMYLVLGFISFSVLKKHIKS